MFPYMEICQPYFAPDEYCFPCAFVEGMCRIVFLDFKPWRKYIPRKSLATMLASIVSCHIWFCYYIFCRLCDSNWWWPFWSNFVIPIWIPDGIFLETLSESLRFTSGATPANLLAACMAAELFHPRACTCMDNWFTKKLLGWSVESLSSKNGTGIKPSLTGSY